MDYGWDTSDEEGGMAIDLDAKQDEHTRSELTGQTPEAKHYDPSEPTEDYDPAEPTNDEADGTDIRSNSVQDSNYVNKPEEPPEYDPAEPTLSDEDGDSNCRVDNPFDSEQNMSPCDSQNEEKSHSAIDSENKILENCSSSVDSSAAAGCQELNEQKSLDAATRSDGSPIKTYQSESVSPPLCPLDTDENTQNSLMDDVNSDVPDVSFDDSDFVLEKEPFAPDSESGNNTWSKDKNNMLDPLEADTVSENKELPHSEQERYRRQEEVDSRNEEALVDLFREESDPERIEDDVEQPVKKVKKKAGSKKIKKKGKKIKKGLGKKSQKKHEDEIEDQRFVELRRDRTSIESIEEGELDGEGPSLGHRTSFDDRMSLNVYEQVFDVVSGQMEEPREPGEIVEESRKRSTKKKEKREKKKKKSKREVATIEEGNQGDEDSQKFPSFLAGFFVQDEGEEEVDENAALSRSFNNDGETFQKTGVKNYRKRHSSGADDSVKSFEHLDADQGESQESDHRKSRKHDERRQDSREVRQREIRDSREVRHEHRHGTPRDREREREREKARNERERERAREKERENREREREREVVRDRRRVEVEERRRRHTRSGSRDRRRRSASAERVRRSRSRERTARQRRHRSKSRDRSIERDRERGKRKHRDRSHDRESERRVRRPTHSRSRSPHRRSERASSNKENRDESYRRRRRHARAAEDSDTDDRESTRRSQRRQRRERVRSSSASSSASTSDSNVNIRSSHHRSFHRGHSSDEGASSDVILVEPERIVINLDEEEDPPSRVDITHHNIDDGSTKLVDGESIPPPPELSHNSRGSALIRINPAEPENDSNEIGDEPEGDATPTRDEPTDSVSQSQRKSVPESDYDPAHPTEEPEEHDNVSVTTQTLVEGASAPLMISPALRANTPSSLCAIDSGPVPPDHPPPEEVRPSPPPVPSLSESLVIPSLQPIIFNSGLRPHLSPFQQQPSLTSQQPSPQNQPGLLPFPGAPPGQNQRFPPWSHVNGPNPNIIHQNAGPPGFVPGQRGLLPTPDTRPLFQLDSTRPPPNFASSLMSQPPPPRETMPLLNASARPPMPMSNMAPLAQLTSLLPALDRAKMTQHREDQQVIPQQQQPQMFKHPLPMSNNIMSKGPLMSNSVSNMSPAMRVSRSGRGGGGGELAESTEVVDMDMSPGEDDCELELPSPNSSDSERDERRRRVRKSDSRSNRTSNDISKTVPVGEKGVIQPAAYLKALSKVIEKLTPKGHQGESVSTAPQEKSKSHFLKKQRLDVDDDVPASAVELTNKEKFLKKLHLQERVIDEVKLAIKPFYSSKKITKEQYKLILRKAVPKVCHSKSGNINPQKIQQLVEAYVSKISKGSQPSGKKKKGHQPKEATGPKDGPGTTTAAPPTVRQNGERAKKVNR
ncbi:hypothetical protein Btru_020522 [Bulinus truncatus]|nr:hypothetical protein Btru_020522 [Bulinus truncatus]